MIIAIAQTIRPILVSIVTGLICNFIWLFEIFYSKGWYGLQWLDGYMNSVFVIIPLTVFSLLISIRFYLKIKIKSMLMSVLLLSFISFISFEIARMFLYSIYSSFFFLGYSTSISILITVIGFLTPITIFSVGYYSTISKLIIRMPRKAIFIFVLSILLSVIFGLITVIILPGFGVGQSFIDSVKMGYPIFWLNISFGFVSIIVHRLRLDKTNINEKHDT